MESAFHFCLIFSKMWFSIDLCLLTCKFNIVMSHSCGSGRSFKLEPVAASSQQGQTPSFQPGSYVRLPLFSSWIVLNCFIRTRHSLCSVPSCPAARPSHGCVREYTTLSPLLRHLCGADMSNSCQLNLTALSQCSRCNVSQPSTSRPVPHHTRVR